MDPASIASTLQTFGGWGVAALLVGALGIVWKALQESQAGRLEDTKQSNATVYAALKTLETAISFYQNGRQK